MATLKIENYFSNSESKLLLELFTKEMQKLSTKRWNLEKAGKSTTKIDKRICDLRTIQITMDIWKCEKYNW